MPRFQASCHDETGRPARPPASRDPLPLDELAGLWLVSLSASEAREVETRGWRAWQEDGVELACEVGQ